MFGFIDLQLAFALTQATEMNLDRAGCVSDSQSVKIAMNSIRGCVLSILLEVIVKFFVAKSTLIYVLRKLELANREFADVRWIFGGRVTSDGI